MGIRVRNFFNFPASNLPNCYFFTLFVVGVALALDLEGGVFELESEDKIQPVSQ